MHSNNLKTNIRVSLGINEKFFRNANDMRSTFIGDLKKINDKDESALLKDKFINSHDDAFYINFNDFNIYKLDTKYISLNKGFGKAYNINLNKYYNAEADLISLNSYGLIYDINRYHSKDIASYLEKKIDSEVISYEIKKIDRFGFDIRVYLKDDDYLFSKVHRLSFNRDINLNNLKEEILMLLEIEPKLKNKSVISNFLNKF